MSHKSDIQLVAFTANNIDGKTVANTNIVNFPAGDARDGTAFVPLFVNAECVAQSGTSVVPTISVGWSASTTNVLAASPLTGLTSANKALQFSVVSPIVTANIGTGAILQVRVTVGATATSYTLRVSVIGFFR